MLMYLQRGLPIIYYGEELGLKNLEFSDTEQFKDETVADFVQSAEKAGKSKQDALKMASLTHKLPARGPMPWNSAKGNGFTTAVPWIAGKKVDQANVLDEVNDRTSMFNFYKKLIALKKTNLFQKGSYYLLATDKNSYVYERDLATGSAIVAVSLSQKRLVLKFPRNTLQKN